MPSIIRNLFRRSSNNSNNQAQQNNRQFQPPSSNNNVARAGGQNVQQSTRQMLNHTVNRPSAPPRSEVEPRRLDYQQVAHLSLTDLRVGNEPDHQLVTIPRRRSVQSIISGVQVSHPDTDHLQGQDYLRAIGSDPELGRFFKNWVNGRNLVRANLQGPRLAEAVSKLRLIANACRNDEELKQAIEMIAIEADTACSDRSSYYMNFMWSQAFVAGLEGSADMDTADLFNLGVAFCRLHLLKKEVAKLILSNDNESVESGLHAEHALKDRLQLPIDVLPPRYQLSSRLTGENIDAIEHNVKLELSKNEGLAVTNFLSNWQPWVEHTSNLERYRDRKDELTEAFQTALGELENDREIEGSPTNLMSEHDYYREQVKLGQALKTWQRELAGQESWEYRATERANQLMDSGRMPQAFLAT